MRIIVTNIPMTQRAVPQKETEANSVFFRLRSHFFITRIDEEFQASYYWSWRPAEEASYCSSYCIVEAFVDRATIDDLLITTRVVSDDAARTSTFPSEHGGCLACDVRVTSQERRLGSLAACLISIYLSTVILATGCSSLAAYIKHHRETVRYSFRPESNRKEKKVEGF